MGAACWVLPQKSINIDVHILGTIFSLRYLWLQKITYMKTNSIVVYLGIVLIGTVILSGCKSQKKVTQAPEPEKKEEVKKEEPVKETVKEEEPVKTAEEKTTEAKIDDLFQKIADASDVNLANNNIREVMSYFDSKDTPVFIAFYKEDGKKDYDKPTTIEKYLNYLKDQKKNPYKIDIAIYNDDGKIEELELITR